MLLSIYLNDHLAGATAARELARRSSSSNRGSGYGGELERIAREIDEDRGALLELMRTLDVGVDRLKVVSGWTAEKVGRLKLNGRILGYSPLSRLVEVEGILLGVRGKLALWTTLRELPHADVPVARLDGLIGRAEDQLERLEALRRRAATDAFVAKSG